MYNQLTTKAHLGHKDKNVKPLGPLGPQKNC